MHAGALAELRQAQVCVLDMPAHAQVRTVYLQGDDGLCHRLVFVLHGLGDGIEVGLLVLVVVIAEDSEMTPGDAALMNGSAAVPLTAALRLSVSVRAASSSRTLIAALQAGILRRERPGSPNTRFSKRGNWARSW
jgi:hypothetical protein